MCSSAAPDTVWLGGKNTVSPCTFSTGKRVLLVTHDVVMKWKFSYRNLQECCKYAFPAHYLNQVRAPKCAMTYQSNIASYISTILYCRIKVFTCILCIIHCTH